jgi:DsbC/DsbD-like thiol-disulfide interchange protein
MFLKSVAFLAGIAVVAQVRPVTWTAAAPKGAAAPGSTVPVSLTATVDDGWHLYSTTQPPGGPIPTRITVAPSPAFAAGGTVTFPKPTVAPDPNFGINVETYDRTVTFTIPVKVAPSAPKGADTATVQARFQACNATACRPARSRSPSRSRCARCRPATCGWPPPPAPSPF